MHMYSTTKCPTGGAKVVYFWLFVYWFGLLFDDKVSCEVAQSGIKLLIFLPQLSKDWDYNQIASYLAIKFHFFSPQFILKLR